MGFALEEGKKELEIERKRPAADLILLQRGFLVNARKKEKGAFCDLFSNLYHVNNPKVAANITNTCCLPKREGERDLGNKIILYVWIT